MNVYQTVLALISMLVIGFLRRIRSLLPVEGEGATAIRVCAVLGVVSGLLCTQFAYAACQWKSGDPWTSHRRDARR